jgi:hypothetical protein
MHFCCMRSLTHVTPARSTRRRKELLRWPSVMHDTPSISSLLYDAISPDHRGPEASNLRTRNRYRPSKRHDVKTRHCSKRVLCRRRIMRPRRSMRGSAISGTVLRGRCSESDGSAESRHLSPVRHTHCDRGDTTFLFILIQDLATGLSTGRLSYLPVRRQHSEPASRGCTPPSVWVCRKLHFPTSLSKHTATLDMHHIASTQR